MRSGPVLAVIAAVLALSSCSSANNSTSSDATVAPPGTSANTSPPGPSAPIAADAGFLACEVTDTDGINDGSFNASAYQGLQQAKAVDSSITYSYLGSPSTSDYAPNIDAFLDRNCGIIVTVGSDMGNATQAAAQQNPGRRFAIVNYSYSPNIPNVLGLTYETNQGAFLGGYLAAAMSKSGAVGTFGGQNIPSVTMYMDGFVAGVRYYDQVHRAHIKAFGWSPSGGRTGANPFNGNGLFTNDLTNQALGKTAAQTLISQGADVIFPVAGAVSLGAAAAAQSANAAGRRVAMEWVDSDGCVSVPQYCSLFITSVEEGIVPSVKGAVLASTDGSFEGGVYVGNLANGGVALAPFHLFASKVPVSLQAELPAIAKGIESGKISVDPTHYPAS
jgi:basic membrane protein A